MFRMYVAGHSQLQPFHITESWSNSKHFNGRQLKIVNVMGSTKNRSYGLSN